MKSRSILIRVVSHQVQGADHARIDAVRDVVEKPAPGVITITEFEETDIREAGAGEEPLEES